MSLASWASYAFRAEDSWGQRYAKFLPMEVGIPYRRGCGRVGMSHYDPSRIMMRVGWLIVNDADNQQVFTLEVANIGIQKSLLMARNFGSAVGAAGYTIGDNPGGW